MDITRCFLPYYEKVQFIEYETIFDNNGQIDQHSKHFKPFKDHLPLIGETFWESVLLSLTSYIENNIKPDINQELKNYILLLIKWYNVEFADKLGIFQDDKAAILSCRFYLNLIRLEEVDLSDNLCYMCLKCVKRCCDKTDLEKSCLELLIDLKYIITNRHLSDEILSVMVSFLVSYIKKTSYVKIRDLYDETSPKYICQESLKCLKCFTMRELNSGTSNRDRKLTIYFSILSGIKLIHVQGNVSMQKNIHENFFVLVSDLKDFIIDKDESQNFLIALTFVIVKECNVDFKETLRIINIMGENFYKSAMDRLILICHAKSTTNKQRDIIIKLFGFVLNNLPNNYYSPDKLLILIQSLLKTCFLCFQNCDEAVTLISNISNSELRSEIIKIVTSDSIFSIKNTLFVVCKKFDMSFSDRQLNKQILIIFFHLLSVPCNKYSIFFYKQFIDLIGDGVDPADVKPALTRITDSYAALSGPRPEIAKKIVKFVYKMAVHQNVQSIHFLTILFNKLIDPDEQKDFRNDFIQLLNSEIQLEKYIFFDQCINNRLLNDEIITKLMQQIYKKDFLHLKITCKFIDKFQSYKNLDIVNFILSDDNNLIDICLAADLLFILCSILEHYIKNNQNIPREYAPNLKKIKDVIRNNLLNFFMPFNAIGNSIRAVNLICTILSETNDKEILFNKVNDKISMYFTSPLDNNNPVPIMYAAELSITSKDYFISETIINSLLDYIKNILQSDILLTKSETKIYYCLSLLIRLSIKNHDLTQTTWQYLKKSIKIFENKSVSYYLTDLIFDFCVFSTHTVDEYLPFLFKNLTSADRKFRKQAMHHLLYFIHHDQLKPSPQQFCLLVATLTDQAVTFSAKNELKIFLLKQQQLLEKYLFIVILHLSFYETNNFYPMSPVYTLNLKKIITDDCNKWKLYSDLYRLLPQRSQFFVLNEISNQFFVRFIKNEINLHNGLWDCLNSCISLYKINAYDKLHNNNFEEFCDKQKEAINHAIVNKNSVSEDAVKYPEHRSMIGKISQVLLQLMFFSKDKEIVKKYQSNLFEAIMLWTYMYLYDISHICQNKFSEIGNNVQELYLKLINLYDESKQSLLENEIISEFNEMLVYNFAQILERE